MSDKPSKNAAKLFVELILQGVECWTKAGKIAAEEIQKDSSFVDSVCDEHPDLTPEFVRRFELIGLQKLHPQFVINESPGVRRLRRLPYSLQEHYVSRPAELLVLQKGSWETLKVDVRNLTPDQAAQVFSESGARSAAEQRAYVEDKFAKRAAPPSRTNLPYRISGGKLVVLVPAQFSRKELANILSEMEN